MPNRKQRRHACVVCGREREPAERLSARGKCPECGDGRMIENVRELIAHAGPQFDAWRRGMARSVGAVLPEELEELGPD